MATALEATAQLARLVQSLNRHRDRLNIAWVNGFTNDIITIHPDRRRKKQATVWNAPLQQSLKSFAAVIDESRHPETNDFQRQGSRPYFDFRGGYAVQTPS